ncbi:M15 family metallopeptidase [Cellulomonas sp. S1-8]|uniref:M15 family metallopeptidase n=1 Tax=Cellulomonas sp. S1-8 TaxID=2904790 RepID=UPI002243F06D|nr:M15 family metallopeptidase [Cellulomonas sp. S1-8]UZN04609.1 M15 family metallopeptidase [Cellulomonas sp. S1-8]
MTQDVPRRRSTRFFGRAGVLAALVSVTVVVPVSQGMADGEILVGTPVADASLPSTVAALTALPLSDLPPTPLVSTDGSSRLRALAEVSRDAERSALPGCDGTVRPSGENGLLATKDLCTLWDGRTQMRADAAVALAELNEAHVSRFGTDLCLSSGYRTLAQQRSVKAQKGGLAATPGKSNHGWGLAMDFCSIQTSGARWTWLNDNAPTYGWENPSWAVRGGSGPYEPWHWEYIKGVQADGEYYG